MTKRKEHRAFARIPVTAQAQVRTRGRMASYAMIVNFSMGGLLLTAAPPLKVGNTCEVILGVTGDDDAIVKAKGKVVRVDEAGTAIQFEKALDQGLYLKVASTSLSVSVSPATVTVNAGAKQQFTATVLGQGTASSAVTWSADRGTITAAGVYTAPATGGADVVAAYSVANPLKKAVASVTVVVPAAVTSVAVSPAAVTVNAGTQTQYTAVVTGTGSYKTAVTWSAKLGTITSAGLYTAPAAGGSDVVTATSVQTPGKTASSAVTVVVPATVTSVTVSPATVTVNAGAKTQFTATVTGTGKYNSAVTWSADRGLITSTGLYTAPATGGPDVVAAFSVQTPSKKGPVSVTVVVPAAVTSVKVTPGTLLVSGGAQTQFAATVTGTGSYNPAVTWAAKLGSVTSSGLYTAPTEGGNDVVTAASVQTPAQTGAASITATVPAAVTSVTVSPAAVTLNSGATNQFTASVAGTGAFSSAVTWSAKLGTITSAGLYTAPSAAGTDVVTATSVQTSGQTSSSTITVNALTVKAPLAAPVVTGPAEVQANSGPYKASVALGTGLTATWSITGGTLLGSATGSAVQFQVGSGPFATLNCTITNGSASSTTSRPLVVLPFAPRDYLADMKADMAKYASEISAEIATGSADTYYSTSYFLMGMAACADATGDVEVMDALVGYLTQIMAQAQPLVRNGVTYQEWGPFTSGLPGLLTTFQGTGPLARAAAVIARNPVFQARYATQLPQILAFVDQSIFKFWFDKQTGYYADPGSAWLGGAIPWVDQGGWGTYPVQVDTCDHFGMISTWMYQATGSPLYLEYATRVAKGFRTHLAIQNGAWIWDQGRWPIAAGENLDGSPDTSHANREAMMVVAMYEAGIEYQLADVQLLAATLTSVIWNQDSNNPLFTNYIDGANLDYRTATAWQNGIVYHGWDMVGRYSPLAQRVLAISYNNIQTQTSMTMDISLTYNASEFGRFQLAGALARNCVR